MTNVFYSAGAADPVYYYHFFYLIPATLRAVAAGVSIEPAFGLQSAVVGMTTAGMFYLIVKRFTGGDGPASLAALLCTAVGSLDIVSVLLRGVPVITVDAWADPVVRIHNFLNQMIWSPQNVLGVLILLLGVYTLSRKGWWRGWLILGPLLGAAMIGSTVWVTMTAFAGVGCYLLVEAVSHRRQPTLAVKRLAAGAIVGLLILAAGTPSLLGYSEMSRRIGKGLTTEWPHQWNALLGRLVSPGIFANLLDLPWVLLLELGPLILFPLLLPRRIWKRAWNDAGLRLLLLSAVVAVAGFVTFRSHFTVNDFGQKTMLVAMAAGVVLAAALLSPRRATPTFLNPLGWSLHEHRSGHRRTKTAVFVALVLLAGLPVGLYEAPLTAIRRYLPQAGPLSRAVHAHARRAAAEAGAYQFLRYGLPANAVIQSHWDADRLNLVQIARKPLGVTTLETDTMVFHPADAAAHERCLREVSESLATRGPAERCHDTLHRYGITHVFVGLVEAEAWQGLEKFDDRRYFRPVFDDGRTRVLALE